MSRIDDKPRTASITREYKFAIGYHNCKACGAETPEPPQSVIDGYARDHGGKSTLWPNDDWEVPGWTNLLSYGWICDRCSRAVMSLLASRIKGQSPLATSDFALLEANVVHALELARGGLLNDFPPFPRRDHGREYSFLHPTLRYCWRTLEEYRTGMMRGRIREIENALLGRVDRLEDE